MEGERVRRSFGSVDSSDNKIAFRRSRTSRLWRPSSLVQLFRTSTRDDVLHSHSSTDSSDTTFGKKSKNMVQSLKENFVKKGWNTIVTVVIVEAKELPDPPSDGSQHSLYCKIRLSSETHKSKAVQSSRHPEWRERLKLHLNVDHLLRVSLWDKGKNKNFMGSCVIDLSTLEKERSHEIWQTLDEGFGAIHLNVTMCAVRETGDYTDSGPSLQEMKEKFDIYDLNDWKTVGQLHVKVVGAKGLSGKPSAYCTLELANARVQTPNVRAGAEPTWNKNYVFNVYDVTNTLDLKLYDSILGSSLGKLTIPLLRIQNGEPRWYALKDKSRRSTARGNCPRVLLEMSLIWNPVKASLRLFSPMEIKYIRKPPKFDLALVYSNTIFVRDTFHFLIELNEIIKRLFEWDNRELSTSFLLAWLVFWYYFQPWAVPLLLLLPFIYFWLNRRNRDERYYLQSYNNRITVETGHSDDDKTSLASKIQGLPEVTLCITGGIEYIASVAERLYNLASFKVPFLSYLTMVILLMASVGLYLIPFNYLLMGFGLFKYTRKHLNPQRILNNDLLDFISRVPDNEILKSWEELSVPEPLPKNSYSGTLLVRSNSSSL